MPLPTFSTLEEVPDAFRSEYEEKDGKWVPKPQGEDVSGLKTALDKERTARTEAERKAREAEDARAEAERRAQDAATAAEAKGAGIDSEKLAELREKIRNDVRAEFDVQLREKEEKIEELEGVARENRTLKLDNAVKKVFADNGVRPERTDTLFRLAEEEFDLTEDGKPVLKNHPGKALEVFVKDDLKKQYPEFYRGTQADGGGVGGHIGGTPPYGTTADDVLKNPGAALDAARRESPV